MGVERFLAWVLPHSYITILGTWPSFLEWNATRLLLNFKTRSVGAPLGRRDLITNTPVRLSQFRQFVQKISQLQFCLMFLASTVTPNYYSKTSDIRINNTVTLAYTFIAGFNWLAVGKNTTTSSSGLDAMEDLRTHDLLAAVILSAGLYWSAAGKVTAIWSSSLGGLDDWCGFQELLRWATCHATKGGTYTNNEPYLIWVSTSLNMTDRLII